MAMLDDIINLRRTLHRYPELSNLEFDTSRRISEFMRQFKPDQEVMLSKTGKAFIFDSGKPGNTVVFRAELDALPIQETTDLAWRSLNPHIAHLCGHDGHMAILLALSSLIAENRPDEGKVVILFQPAEENELGAKDVVESPAFQKLQPDYIFALHNIPGAPLNQVLIKDHSFSAASKGLTVQLKGITAHAAEAEKGISPVPAVGEISRKIQELVQAGTHFKDHVFATAIYIRSGEVAFGVAPDFAEMGITLRAFRNDDMESLSLKAEELIKGIAEEHQLNVAMSYSEIYPATQNNPECTALLRECAEALDLDLKEMDKPNRWSEDFAYFTATIKGAQFGFGAGEDQPNLHNPNYDFPDELIEPASGLFFEVYKKLCL